MQVNDFCQNPSLDLYKNIPEIVRDFFYRAAKYCFEKKKGNIVLANLVIHYNNEITGFTPLYQRYDFCQDLGLKKLPSNCDIPEISIDREDHVNEYYTRFLASIINPSVEVTDKVCDLLKRFSVSDDWISKQRKYLEKKIVYDSVVSYSYKGDRLLLKIEEGKIDRESLWKEMVKYGLFYYLVTKIIRKTTDFSSKHPEIYQEFQTINANVWFKTLNNRERWMYLRDKMSTKGFEVVKSYVIKILPLLSEKFNQFVNNAPPLEKDIVVFRGLATSKHIKTGETFTSTRFMSTSTSLQIAYDFALKVYKTDKSRALLWIHLPKGFRGIMIHDMDEHEILLPIGTKVYFEDCFQVNSMSPRKRQRCEGKDMNMCVGYASQ